MVRAGCRVQHSEGIWSGFSRYLYKMKESGRAIGFLLQAAVFGYFKEVGKAKGQGGGQKKTGTLAT